MVGAYRIPGPFDDGDDDDDHWGWAAGDVIQAILPFKRIALLRTKLDKGTHWCVADNKGCAQRTGQCKPQPRATGLHGHTGTGVPCLDGDIAD